MKFVHLHNHTHYSLLDGLTKLDELIAFAKEDEAPAVAITDHGSMYGVVEFYQKCKKAGIKPIIGMEAYTAPKSRFDKNTRTDERNYHLILLAKNAEGYKNLIKLCSIGHMEGFYYKPRIDWESLQKYHHGLIASTACVAGEIPQLILSGKAEKAKSRALEFQELFGEGNFYFEMQDHPAVEGQDKVNTALIEMSEELGIPLIATNDIHYLTQEDYDVQDVLLCLQTKKKKDDEDRFGMEGRDFYYKKAKEMEKAFSHIPQALENTVRIAEMCNVEIELGSIHLPFFDVPESYTDSSFLKELCVNGFKRRYGIPFEQADNEKQERLEYELSVIERMGFPSYFLIVADFVNWAKENGVIVGPGRGSAAGSFVSFLTGITNIDPLKYELLFERFLNPDRVSMPDIDMDFADIRRDEVIRYVESKYGKDHVSQIITFGTLAARAAVRDVGRVLGFPYEFCDRLAKMIPGMMKLEKALKSSPELKNFYDSDEGAKKIMDYAKKLEGVARHVSTHACGVLITKDPLTEYVPIQYASSQDNNVVSQYSLHPVEDLGLLKMDFLGLSNLTIIESAIKIIKKTRGITVDIDAIPLDDPSAFKLFQNGETTGVFQFESAGMKRYLKELKPTNFEDIIAMVALYRPGPMELIPDYIASKHGRKKIKYIHPKLESVLAKTYGVAIYQEQVMQISRRLAGFSMGDSDLLRKAMGKKIPELLAQQKEKFIDGSVKNSISKELAEQVWAFIEPFAGYGFNRSHAACYAMIGYQTAYLKAHWPTEFMAALLISDQNNTDRVAIEIEECRNMGIKVLPPDINQSYDLFTVVTSGTEANEPAKEGESVDTIRFGLKAIKNVGHHIAEAIISEKKENGKFSSITDFLKRIKDKDLNKKSLESLIKSGCFDSFEDRGKLMANLDLLLNYNKELAKAAKNAQVSLFGDLPSSVHSETLNLKQAGTATRQNRLSWERELMGLYITEHPFLDFKKLLTGHIVPIAHLPNVPRENEVAVSGIVTTIKKIITKKNENMLFVKIEDELSNVEALVFPKLLKETLHVWKEGAVVFCRGKISDKDQEVKLLCNFADQLEVETLESKIAEILAKKSDAPHGTNNYYNHLILVISRKAKSDHLSGIYELLKSHEGSDKVFLKIPKNGSELRTIESGIKVSNNEALKRKLLSLFGEFVFIADGKK